MTEAKTERKLTRSSADSLDIVIAVLFAALTYLPSKPIYNYIRLGLVAVIFLFKLSTGEPDKKLNKIAICMVASPLVSGAFVFLLELGSVNTVLIIHEIQRLLFCAMLIVTIRKLKLSFKVIYIITVLILVPNFIIQVLQYFQVGWVFDFIQNNYIGNTDAEFTHLDLARSEKNAQLRCGSIFVNPNVYMAIPLYAVVVFLHRDMERKNIINYALIACAIVSGFLTGSRTATVSFLIILGIYVFRYANPWSRLIFLIAAVVIAVQYGSELLSSRSFQLENADENSLGTKIQQFGWYFSSANPLYWITGSIGASEVSMFDSEIGHIYAWYGVFGIFWYFSYYKFIWQNCNKKVVFYAKPMIYITLLVAFTASVLLCMPIYPFAALVLFADIELGSDVPKEEVKE